MNPSLPLSILRCRWLKVEGSDFSLCSTSPAGPRGDLQREVAMPARPEKNARPTAHTSRNVSVVRNHLIKAARLLICSICEKKKSFSFSSFSSLSLTLSFELSLHLRLACSIQQSLMTCRVALRACAGGSTCQPSQTKPSEKQTQLPDKTTTVAQAAGVFSSPGSSGSGRVSRNSCCQLKKKQTKPPGRVQPSDASLPSSQTRSEEHCGRTGNGPPQGSNASPSRARPRTVWGQRARIRKWQVGLLLVDTRHTCAGSTVAQLHHPRRNFERGPRRSALSRVKGPPGKLKLCGQEHAEPRLHGHPRRRRGGGGGRGGGMPTSPCPTSSQGALERSSALAPMAVGRMPIPLKPQPHRKPAPARLARISLPAASIFRPNTRQLVCCDAGSPPSSPASSRRRGVGASCSSSLLEPFTPAPGSQTQQPNANAREGEAVSTPRTPQWMEFAAAPAAWRVASALPTFVNLGRFISFASVPWNLPKLILHVLLLLGPFRQALCDHHLATKAAPSKQRASDKNNNIEDVRQSIPSTHGGIYSAYTVSACHELQARRAPTRQASASATPTFHSLPNFTRLTAWRALALIQVCTLPWTSPPSPNTGFPPAST